MELARRVAKNTFYNVSALIIGSVSGLFLTIFLARILKHEQFGIYSLALSIAMLATSLSSLGIDGAVVRYTAYYDGIHDVKGVRTHLRYFLKIRIILSIIVFSTLLSCSKWIAVFFHNEALFLPFIISAFITLFYSFMVFFDSFFKGLQKFEFTFAKQVIYEGARWVFVLPLATTMLAVGALIGVAISFFVAFLFLTIILIFKYSHYIFGEVDDVYGKVEAFIGYMTIASLSGIIYAYIDTIMIGYLLTTTDVGYYRASYTVVFAIAGLISSFCSVLFPTFTQMTVDEINKALNRLIRYSAMLTFPLSFVLYFLSEKIILFIYGADYLPAVDVMHVLAFILIVSSFDYLYSIFSAKEVPEITATLNVFGMLLNIFLNYILILKFGIVGAAMATVLSRIIVLACVIVALYKLFKIVFNLRVPLKLLLFVIFDLIIVNYLAVDLSIKLLSALVVYFVLLIITRTLTLDDIKYFINVLKP